MRAPFDTPMCETLSNMILIQKKLILYTSRNRDLEIKSCVENILFLYMFLFLYRTGIIHMNNVILVIKEDT